MGQQPSSQLIYDPILGRGVTLEEAKALNAERARSGGPGQGDPGGGQPPAGPPMFGFQTPTGPDEPAPGQEPLDLGGTLAQVAGFSQMIPGLNVPGKLLTAFAPAAVRAVQQLTEGDMDAGELVSETALGLAPTALRGGLQLPARATNAMGTYTRALTRGGSQVNRGMPTVTGTATARAGRPLGLDQLKRLGGIAQAERLGIDPESFARLVDRSTVLENEIVKRLPKQVIYNQGDDLVALARKHRVDPKLIQAFDDTSTIYTLLKQSERAGAISGGQPSRLMAGYSTGGLASGLTYLGTQDPLLSAAAGFATGLPFGLLNMSPRIALKTANILNTVADKGAPIAEGMLRTGVTAYPRRRPVKTKDEY